MPDNGAVVHRIDRDSRIHGSTHLLDRNVHASVPGCDGIARLIASVCKSSNASFRNVRLSHLDKLKPLDGAVAMFGDMLQGAAMKIGNPRRLNHFFRTAAAWLDITVCRVA